MLIANLISRVKSIVLVTGILLALFFVLPALTTPLTLTMAESAPLTLGVLPLLALGVLRHTGSR